MPHLRTTKGSDRQRQCLRCDRHFHSHGPSNRRCPRCHHAIEHAKYKLGTAREERVDGEYVYV